MSIEITIQTGNPIVDEVGQINFSGNIIPESWYKTIVDENGKPNLLAINILADIVYWYKPSEIRTEDGQSVTFQKKFADEDYLQRSYEQLIKKYNCSDSQARRSIKFLEDIGVIRRIFRTITTPNGLIPNVMFIELIPGVLRELTFPPQKNFPDERIADPSLHICRDVSANMITHPDTPAETNTKNTTKNTSKNITTTDSSAVVVSNIKDFIPSSLRERISESDFKAIINAANGDKTIIYKAFEYANNYSGPIGNLVGFIISYIRRGGFTCVTIDHKPPRKQKNNFTTHNYCMPFLEWTEKHKDMSDDDWLQAAEQVLGYHLSESQRNSIPEVYHLLECRFRELETQKAI